MQTPTPEPSPPAESAENQHYAQALDRLVLEFGRRWTQRRLIQFVPIKLANIALLWLGGVRGAAAWWALGAYAVLLVTDIHASLRAHTAPPTRNSIVASILFMQAMMMVSAAATGGVHSPFFVAVMAPVVIPAAAFGRRPETYIFLTSMVVLSIIVALQPIPSMNLTEPYGSIATVVTVVYCGWMCVANIVELTEVYGRAAETAGVMRDALFFQHRERTRSLEGMGARVGHELKNPLAAISGLVQLLRRGEHDGKTRERLEVVETEVGRMESIVRDYLEFHRPLEALAPTPCDLGRLTDEVISVLEAAARAKDVTIRRRGDERCFLDRHRVRDALINVVDNAVEASHPRGVIDIDIGRCDGRVSIVVRDHGKGMTPEVLARVGTPYFTTREQGTGLGVVLARAAIAQHGGSMLVESTLGVGTTVTLALPTEPTPAGEASSFRAPTEVLA